MAPTNIAIHISVDLGTWLNTGKRMGMTVPTRTPLKLDTPAPTSGRGWRLRARSVTVAVTPPRMQPRPTSVLYRGECSAVEEIAFEQKIVTKIYKF